MRAHLVLLGLLLNFLLSPWSVGAISPASSQDDARPQAVAQAERQLAARLAAEAALKAPLAPQDIRVEEAVGQPGGGRGLQVAIIVLLLALIGVGIVLIFRIPSMASSVPFVPAVEVEPPEGPAQTADAAGLRIANPRFLELAAERQLITPAESSDLAARFRGNDFAALLFLALERPLLKEQFGKAWGDSIGVTHVSLDKVAIQPGVTGRIPREFAEEHQVVPIYSFGDSVSIASADPQSRKVEELIINRFNINPSFVFAFPDEIADLIAITYRSVEELKGMAAELRQAQKEIAGKQDVELTTQDLLRQAGNRSVVGFVNGLILLGMNEMASDIHIEPDDQMLRIRFRIDGILQERFVLEKSIMLSLVSRLKLMAGCNIAERRLPQDGRIKFAVTRRKIDIRFSTVPTLYGEKIVLRLLGSTFLRGIPNITEMDFSASVMDSIKRVVHAPNGVFFITGPTGSGKTTTLYSILKYINTPGINIMTVEDPVEYRLPGINQVQVNTAIDLDFVRVLRAFLRQDPNVILIGEIRDIESARIASQAALTGHLVFATMHTNNALQAVSRMIDIGVEPFLVAPSLIALMAQRLVRRICPYCKEKYPAPREVLDEEFTWDGTTEVFFYRGRGCPKCRGTGFMGRLAIHELFILNAETREQIAHNASILAVEEVALKSGFKPLRHDGLKKVLRGLTTIEEVDRVTYADTD